MTIDTAGVVSEVVIERDWAGQVSPELLGTAVVRAWHTAVAARLTSWTEAATEDVPRESRPALAPAVEPAELERALHRMAGSGPADLLSVMDRVDQALAALRQEAHVCASQVHTGHSLGRHVSISAHGGGEVLEVRYDMRWLRTASAVSIARETHQAFEAVFALTGSHGTTALLADSPIQGVLDQFQPEGTAVRDHARGEPR